MGRAIALAVLTLACGKGGSAFTAAAHDPLPQLQANQGTVLKTPRLVTITYAGHELQSQIESFADFIAGSHWLGAVGSEYGVGKATSVKVRLTDAAPATLNLDGLVSSLDLWMSQGQVPAPDGSSLYVVYTSATTFFFDGEGNNACATGSRALHGAATSTSGITYPWMVVVDCFGDLDDLTEAASSELGSALTDPFLDSYRLALPAGADGEAGELCFGAAPVAEGGYQLSRVWSNAAALQSHNPCVPVPGGEIYYNVSASPSGIQTASAGSTVTFDLTGWSEAPVDSWVLSPSFDRVDFDPELTFSSDRIGNGEHVTVTLTAPAGPRTGAQAVISIYSAGSFDRRLILGIVVR
jgi:hypothetical protein